MSFCSQTKQLPVFKMFISCAFFGSSWSSDTAKQVTCVVRWHMLYQLHFCLDVVTSFSLLCLKVFFPTHSVFPIRFRPVFEQVYSWISVYSHGQVSVMHKTGVLSIVNNKKILTRESLCFTIHSQTHSLEARLWEVSQPFPHFQKRSAVAFALFVVSRCTWVTWQLT